MDNILAYAYAYVQYVVHWMRSSHARFRSPGPRAHGRKSEGRSIASRTYELFDIGCLDLNAYSSNVQVLQVVRITSISLSASCIGGPEARNISKGKDQGQKKKPAGRRAFYPFVHVYGCRSHNGPLNSMHLIISVGICKARRVYII